MLLTSISSTPVLPSTVYLRESSSSAEALSESIDNVTMVLANGLLRIFWPSDVLRNKGQGTIIGWRNSPLDVFIVAVLQDVEVKTQKDY